MIPHNCCDCTLILASLDSHLQSHTGVKPHVCAICGSSFSKQCSLRKHQRTIHEKMREHECEVCAMKVKFSKFVSFN